MAASAPSHFCGPSLYRICRITDELLRPFTEKQPLILTKDTEKRLLVSLAKLSFDLRASAENSLCDDKSIAELYSSAAPSSGRPHNCMKEIVSVLVNYLSVSSQFVRHAAGKTLVALSDFLLQNGSQWEEFIQLLSSILGEAILKVHSSSPKPNLLEITGLFYVLRKILKILKDGDSEQEGSYIPILSKCVLDVNLDMLHDVFVNQDGDYLVLDKGNVFLREKRDSLEAKGVLLGALLQLFCSLVDQDCLGELSSSLSDELILHGIKELVPKFLCWCFSFNEMYSSNFIAVYVRHKVLVLMIRLSSCIIQEYSTLVLWLELLQMYFLDVLDLPFSQSNSGLDDSVEGSPFVLCTADGVKASNLCSWHIWRRVIFLLFKCSSKLINLSNEHGVKSSCTTASSIPLCSIHLNGENCTLGLSILFHWVQRHLPLKKFGKLERYMIQCRNFVASFLQLFVQEDDLLFEMLLELLDFPLIVHPKQSNQNKLPSNEGKVDQIIYLSCIFNPVQLFCLFLKQLHYDQSIFLDYLISKDTGVQCAQYLLRCLHLFCQSEAMWTGFVFAGNKIPPFCKKRRLRFDIFGVDSLEKMEAFSSATRSQHSLLSSVPDIVRQQEFENARDCLFSLKTSIENVHKKNLFPYNPSPLLRSFAKFQELCWKKEKEHTAENYAM